MKEPMDYKNLRTVRIFWDTDVKSLDVSFMEGERRCERHFINSLSNLAKLGVSIPRWCKYGKISSKKAEA